MHVFCDWIEVIVPCTHFEEVLGGYKIKHDSDGNEIQRERFGKTVYGLELSKEERQALKLEDPGLFGCLAMSERSIYSLYNEKMKTDTKISLAFDLCYSDLKTWQIETFGGMHESCPFYKEYAQHYAEYKQAKYDKLQAEGGFEYLWISGNPTKFLTYQNVWGKADFKSAVVDFIFAVIDKLEIELTEYERALICGGHFLVRRFDITTNFRLEKRSDVSLFLKALAAQGTSRYQAVRNCETTVYFGPHSKEKKVRLYDKFAEVCKGLKYAPAQIVDDAVEEARNLVRFEVAYYAKYLRRVGQSFRKLCTYIDNKGGLSEIMSKELEYLNLGQAALTRNAARDFVREVKHDFEKWHREFKDGERKDAPPRFRNSLIATLLAWIEGENVKELLAENTYYKYRRFLKERYHIDIANTCVIGDKSEVIPLIKIIEASTAQPSEKFAKKYLA